MESGCQPARLQRKATPAGSEHISLTPQKYCEEWSGMESWPARKLGAGSWRSLDMQASPHQPATFGMSWRLAAGDRSASGVMDRGCAVRGNRVHGGGEPCRSEIAVCMECQGKAWLWHGLGSSKNVLVLYQRASAGGSCWRRILGCAASLSYQKQRGYPIAVGRLGAGQGWALFF